VAGFGPQAAPERWKRSVPARGPRRDALVEDEGFSSEERAATLVHLAELERVREMVAAASKVETERRRDVPETGEKRWTALPCVRRAKPERSTADETFDGQRSQDPRGWRGLS
jgi:hypothetical protein